MTTLLSRADIFDCHVDDPHQLPWTDFDTCTLAELPTPIPEIGPGGYGSRLRVATEHPRAPGFFHKFRCALRHTPAFELCRRSISLRQHRSLGGSSATLGGRAARRTYSIAQNSCALSDMLQHKIIGVPTETGLSLNHSMPKPAAIAVAKQNTPVPAVPPVAGSRRSRLSRFVYAPQEASKSHLPVGNSGCENYCNGMDHTPWTSRVRLTKIIDALLVTTCRLSV
nr:hypothetical protein JVH1_4203 [Rhodococcus sp. JVH1]